MTRQALLLAALAFAAAPAFAQSTPDTAGVEAADSAVIAPLAGAKIRCVAQTGMGGCFTTIQAAADAANDGDTISVAPGVYYENVTLAKAGLTLQGASKLTTIIDPSPSSAPPVGNMGPGITILNIHQNVKNLTVRNGKTAAIAVIAPFATIQGVLIEAPTCDGIHIIAEGGAQILGKEFRSVGCNGVLADGNSPGTVVKLNALYGAGLNGFQISGDNPVVSNNKAYGCGLECFAVSGTSPVVQFNTVLGSDCSGIDVTGAGAKVTNNSVQNTACTAVQASGADAVVQLNKIADTASDGIHVDGDGARISNNVITDSGLGILVNGASATLSNNKITRTMNDAVLVEGGLATITSNTLDGTREGVIAFGPNPKVELNRLSNVLDIAVDVDCAPGCSGGSIAHNSVTDMYGIDPAFSLSSDAAGMTVANNLVTRPSGTAFDVAGVGIVVEHNSVVDAGTFAADGCFLVEGTGRHQLSFNTATRCAQNGFLIRSNSNTLTNNTVSTSDGNAFQVGTTGGGASFNVLISNTATGAAGAGFAVVNGNSNQLESNTALAGNRTGACNQTATPIDPTNRFASTAPLCDIQR